MKKDQTDTENRLIDTSSTEDHKTTKASLITKSVDPNIKDQNNLKDLTEDHKTTKASLTTKSVDPNIQDQNNWKDLIDAATFGHTQDINRLLEDERNDPNIRDKKGYTPLMRAIAAKNPTAVTALLSNERTDPNVKDKNGRTALVHAMVSRNTAIIKAVLSDKRTDPNIADKEGQTALMHAIEDKNPTAVTALLSNERSNPNVKDKKGCTALIIAILSKNTGAVKAILSNKRTDPNIADKEGRTALMHAIGAKNPTAVTALLCDERTDPNITDKNGDTALMLEAVHGHDRNIATLLNDKRTNPNLKNKMGCTALDYAVKKTHNTVVEMLATDERVNKILDCEKIKHLLSKRTSHLMLNKITLERPYLAADILLHDCLNNCLSIKTRTEFLKHCESMDFFAPGTDACRELTQLIKENKALFKKVPECFTHTLTPPKIATHLGVLKNLFGLDSLVELEGILQTSSPILENQSMSFFEKLSEKGKVDLITYIKQWHNIFSTETPYSTNRSLQEQDDFSEGIQCMKTNHEGNWEAILEPHRKFTKLRDQTDLRELGEDVEYFSETLEKAYYIKNYRQNVSSSEFNRKIQDHYIKLSVQLQQAGTKIQRNYRDTAKKEVFDHLNTNYRQFLKRNVDKINYEFVEEEQSVYCQITHPKPKHKKVIDINTDLKERGLQVPLQQIPHAFAVKGIATELLSLHKALEEKSNLDEVIGEKTLSCLRTCCQNLYGKDLQVTLTDLQNLLKTMQNNPEKTKSSCLFWACSPSEESQLYGNSLFTRKATTEVMPTEDERAADEAIKEIPMSYEEDKEDEADAAAKPREFGAGAAEKQHAMRSSPDKVRTDLMGNINFLIQTLSVDHEISDGSSRSNRECLLEQLLLSLDYLQEILNRLYKEPVNEENTTSWLETMQINNNSMDEKYELIKTEESEYSGFFDLVFTETKDAYERTKYLIELHKNLKLYTGKTPDSRVLFQGLKSNSYKHRSNTYIKLLLTQNINTLRTEMVGNQTTALINFIHRAYDQVKSLRTYNVDNESTQKDFEDIADHLLYFTSLEKSLNPEIPIQDIIQEIEESLLTGKHRQQYSQAAKNNAQLVFNILEADQDEISSVNKKFLLFCLHDCTKKRITEPTRGSAAHKLREIRNAFCHPTSGIVAAEEKSIDTEEINEIMTHFRKHIQKRETMTPGR